MSATHAKTRSNDTLFTLTHSGESAELTVGGVAHNELLH